MNMNLLQQTNYNFKATDSCKAFKTISLSSTVNPDIIFNTSTTLTVFYQSPPDKCSIIYPCKVQHQELTIKSIHQPSMSWNQRCEILLSISAFYCRGKESSKWSYNRCKEGHKEFMDIDGLYSNSRNIHYRN